MLVETSRGLARLICNGGLCHLRFHRASLGCIAAPVSWGLVENPGALIQTLRVFEAACHAFHCVKCLDFGPHFESMSSACLIPTLYLGWLQSLWFLHVWVGPVCSRMSSGLRGCYLAHIHSWLLNGVCMHARQELSLHLAILWAPIERARFLEFFLKLLVSLVRAMIYLRRASLRRAGV